MTRERRLLKAIEGTFDELLGSGDLDKAYGYAEPGYKLTRKQKSILFANWNEDREHNYVTSRIRTLILPSFPNIEEKEILDCIERHYAIEWSDEWTTCDDCNEAVRTEGDCYSWKTSYVIQNECELYCLACADFEAVLPEYINNPEKAWLYDAKYLDEAGFTPLGNEDFHGGIREYSEDPRAIYERLKNPGIDLVFFIDGVEQFGVEVKVFTRSTPIQE
jgi:hypothetical protein